MTEYKKPLILTDIDGVVLQWVSRLPEFLASKGYDTAEAVAVRDEDRWTTMEELMGGVDEETATALFNEYCSSDFLRELDGYKDAVAVINNMKDHFDFVAITAIGLKPINKKNRVANLEALFPGAFSEVHCVDFGASKEKVLARYAGKNPLFYVDDGNKHVREAMNVGINGVQFGNLNRGKDEEMKYDVKVNSWEEIRQVACTMVYMMSLGVQDQLTT